MDRMNGAIRHEGATTRSARIACVATFLVCAAAMPVMAGGPGVNVEPLAMVQPVASAAPSARGDAPWLRPIQRDTPIGSMSALKTEYRRIRDLRRAQLEPEYERRLLVDGEESAEAWRDSTLRDVVRRDRRDLRDRVSR